MRSPRGETARVWASRPQAAPASEGTFWKQQPRVGWAEDTTSHVLGCRVHVTQVGAYAAALSPAPRATGQRPEDVCASPGDRAGRALARMPVLDPWAMRSSGDRCGERAARRALLRAPRSHRPRLATVGRSRPGPWDPPRWTVRPRTPRGPPACVATTWGPRPALLAPPPRVTPSSTPRLRLSDPQVLPLRPSLLLEGSPLRSSKGFSAFGSRSGAALSPRCPWAPHPATPLRLRFYFLSGPCRLRLLALCSPPRLFSYTRAPHPEAAFLPGPFTLRLLRLRQDRGVRGSQGRFVQWTDGRTDGSPEPGRRRGRDVWLLVARTGAAANPLREARD